MIFRSITATNDWQFGSGLSSYATAEKAVILNIRTRLYFFLNDCFWRMNFGIDWLNLIGGKNPAAKIGIEQQCRKMIVESEGVVRINSVTSNFDARSRRLVVTYNIDTVYSRNLSGSISQGN
jgi:hypothetical protein